MKRKTQTALLNMIAAAARQLGHEGDIEATIRMRSDKVSRKTPKTQYLLGRNPRASRENQYRNLKVER